MALSLEKLNAIGGTGNIDHGEIINVIGQKAEKNIQMTLPPFAKPLPDLWKVPCKNWNFIGRRKFLKQIEDHFNKESAPVILTACHGLGGIGKTQVALEFVWQYYKQYKGVVWFDAKNKDHLQLNYVILGEELNIITDKNNIPIKEKVHYVKHWLEDTSHPGWLLIYNNAVNYRDIGELIPTKGGKVLVTSRYTEGWPQVSIPVDVFTIEESRDYIHKVLGNLLLESDETQVDKLLEILGRLPLALTQASAYIKTNKLKISHYLELYERKKKTLLSDKTLSNETLGPDSNQASVFITCDITMDAVRRESPLAATWLAICACLASDDIPNFLLEEFANIKENNHSSEIFEEVLGTLYSYSMLTLNEKRQSASINRLVQEVIQLKWGKEEKENIVIDTFKLIKKCFPNGSYTLKDYDTKRLLFLHLEAFLRCLEAWQQEISTDELKRQIEKNYFVDILLIMAETCLNLGNADKARESLERALSINEKHYGPDHPAVAITLTNLGNAYRELGKAQKARELLERALPINERHYGSDHPEVSITLAYLGNAYRELGNAQKARELLEQALPIKEKYYGPDHPEVAITLTNLGNAYEALGITYKTCDLLKRALAIDVKHYGPDHPIVMVTLTNLRNAYEALGKPEKARDLLKSINEKHYGPDYLNGIHNPNTGNGRYNKKFNELSYIAIGSFGIVCKAIDKKNNRIFAIKKIPINKLYEDKANKETDILSKLNSNFIVKFESFWIEDNYLKADDYKNVMNTRINSSHEVFNKNKTRLLNIQMEFCLLTLKELMKNLNQMLNQNISEVMTPFGYSIASELFIEILGGIDYLHKQNIIHRDLKPNNILLSDGNNGGFIKIADFGLSTIHEFDGQSHTKYKGTIRYAAPGVMRSTNYDTKADIYSLGIIVQELFNIDINKPIGKNTKLVDKYSAIFNVTERMLLLKTALRPDSETILTEKTSWALSLNEIEDEIPIKYKTGNYSEDLKSLVLNSFLFTDSQMSSESSQKFKTGLISVSIGASVVQTIKEKSEFEEEMKKNNARCDQCFVEPEELVANEGDLIQIQRGIYAHWTVYVGNGNVIHLVEEQKGKGKFLKQCLKDITNGDLCRVNNLLEAAQERGLTPKRVNNILKSAYKKLDETSDYHLFKNNCEHFATLCRYGSPFSEQESAAENKSIISTLGSLMVNSISIHLPRKLD